MLEYFETSIERDGREIRVRCQIEAEPYVPARYNSWTGWSPEEGGTVECAEEANVLAIEVNDGSALRDCEALRLTIKLIEEECESIAAAWRERASNRDAAARDAAGEAKLQARRDGE